MCPSFIKRGVECGLIKEGDLKLAGGFYKGEF